MLSVDTLSNIFSLRPNKAYLTKRESSYLEYKESFHIANLAEYGKDFAAFANNCGGFIIFGVKNEPHIPIGLKNTRFMDADEAKITEFLNQHFAPAIDWAKDVYTWEGRSFGVIHIHESPRKPIIAISDGGKKQEIRNGEIYFRYIGRSEKIKHAELTRIIEEKVKQESNRWRELFERISRVGPQNATILDTIEGKIEEGNRTILIDDELLEQIKFIKEGQFREKEGAITLRLIGEVHPVSVVGRKAAVVHDNPYVFRSKDVAELVTKEITKPFRVSPEHVTCWQYYRIRGTYNEGKSQCNSKYCDYLEKVGLFMYTQEWIDFLNKELSDPKKYQKVMSSGKTISRIIREADGFKPPTKRL